MELKQYYWLGLRWTFPAVAMWICSLHCSVFSVKEESSTLLGIGTSATSPSSFPRPLYSWKQTSTSLQVPQSPEDVGHPHVFEACAEGHNHSVTAPGTVLSWAPAQTPGGTAGIVFRGPRCWLPAAVLTGAQWMRPVSVRCLFSRRKGRDNRMWQNYSEFWGNVDPALELRVIKQKRDLSCRNSL